MKMNISAYLNKKYNRYLFFIVLTYSNINNWLRVKSDLMNLTPIRSILEIRVISFKRLNANIL